MIYDISGLFDWLALFVAVLAGLEVEPHFA